jgi:cytochrome b561
VTFLLVAAAIPAGFLMGYTYPLSLRDKLGLAIHQFAGQWHHTLGFLILALTLGRLAWRWMNPVPSSGRAFAFQGPAALATHYGLYALLIALPVSGWLALSVFGEAPIWLFGWPDLMPPITARRPPDDPHGYGFFAGMHVWLLLAGAALLSLHALAALWHHFGRGDDTLRRMWPLGEPSIPRPAPAESPETRSGARPGP